MIHRAVPWLFFAAAMLGLIGYLVRDRVSWWIAGSKVCRVLISLAYLIPHHHFP